MTLLDALDKEEPSSKVEVTNTKPPLFTPEVGAVRVLIVEDDLELAQLVGQYLREKNLEVEFARGGNEALSSLGARPFDVVVLDVIIPGTGGLALCEFIQKEISWTPTIIISALASVSDRLKGFNVGADDYLVKPFSLAELHARITALARRGSLLRPPLLTCGEISLDPLARRVWRVKNEITLTEREFQLLESLIRKAGYVVTRESLLRSAWLDSPRVTINIVEQYIRRLRQKVDLPFGRNDIETIHRLGYRLRAVGPGRNVD